MISSVAVLSSVVVIISVCCHEEEEDFSSRRWKDSVMKYVIYCLRQASKISNRLA